jgi:hypothetical protein
MTWRTAAWTALYTAAGLAASAILVTVLLS